MTAVANPLCRLAPCTSSRSCALCSQNCFSTTSSAIRKTPVSSLRRLRLIDFHHQRRKIHSQNNSAKYQIIFNIHNPNQYHRDRDACGFLLTP
jgi:hypothetical protein